MRIRNSKVACLVFGVGVAMAASTIAASAGTVDMYDGTFSNLTTVVSRPCSPTPCTSPVGFAPSQATITTGVTTPNADSIKADNDAITANFRWSGSSGNTAGVGILDNALTYNPSVDGTITSLDVSFDKMLTFNASPNAARVLLDQDGKYYLYMTPNSASGTTAGQYTNYAEDDLTAASFQQICLVSCVSGTFGNVISPTATPNLTSSGDAIIFGVLYISNSTNGTSSSYYDNFEVDITSAATPLPAALPLFAGGFGVIGLLARRKRQQNTAAVEAA
jgi:hypothetical protein